MFRHYLGATQQENVIVGFALGDWFADYSGLSMYRLHI